VGKNRKRVGVIQSRTEALKKKRRKQKCQINGLTERMEVDMGVVYSSRF
jgi:hypothetical protein